jgi:hypothetical protein
MPHEQMHHLTDDIEDLMHEAISQVQDASFAAANAGKRDAAAKLNEANEQLAKAIAAIQAANRSL